MQNLEANIWYYWLDLQCNDFILTIFVALHWSIHAANSITNFLTYTVDFRSLSLSRSLYFAFNVFLSATQARIETFASNGSFIRSDVDKKISMLQKPIKNCLHQKSLAIVQFS